MNLKKKVIFGMVAGFFAVATVFNMSILKDNGAGDVSLDAVAVMAQAQDENGGGHASICSPIWVVTYSGSVGTSTGVTVSCSTGGSYICPICFWG